MRIRVPPLRGQKEQPIPYRKAPVQAVLFILHLQTTLIFSGHWLEKPNLGTHWLYHLIAPLSSPSPSLSFMIQVAGRFFNLHLTCHDLSLSLLHSLLSTLRFPWPGQLLPPCCLSCPISPLPGFFLPSFYIHLSKHCSPNAPFLLLPTPGHMKMQKCYFHLMISLGTVWPF